MAAAADDVGSPQSWPPTSSATPDEAGTLEELNDIVLRYPYTYRWSSDGQKLLDRTTA